MKKYVALKKLGLLGAVCLVALSTLSYACGGMASGSSSDVEGESADSSDEKK